MDGCTLDIYGEGVLEPAMRKTIESAGLSRRVRLRGRVDHEGCLKAMRSSGALLFTSYGFDTQGLVLLEAAAMSLPTIYCDPALSETVPTGGGILAADPSPAALVRLFGCSPRIGTSWRRCGTSSPPSATSPGNPGKPRRSLPFATAAWLTAFLPKADAVLANQERSQARCCWAACTIAAATRNAGLSRSPFSIVRLAAHRSTIRASPLWVA